MPDDTTKRQVPDHIRINIHEPYELESWAKRLGVTSEELRRLVAKHGVMAADVRRALRDSK
jgi:AraC-like DNA-binding protein